MRKHLGWKLGLLLCSWLGVESALACTTFVLEGGGRIYFGRNMDWFSEDALVIINQRDVRKTAFVTPGNTPAQWTSRYGSVTFNVVGLELPAGGMNEAGLVVENMWLDQTRYPEADSRPALSSLEWIQYQLDNCATVAEVLAAAEQVRIDPAALPPTVHYLVCDASGDCATIEFLDGKLVCHHGDKLPWRALANDPYQDSAAFLKSHPEPQGDKHSIKAAYQKLKSDGRFAHAATRAVRFTPGSTRQDLDYAFETLDDVCQGMYTVWRLVYDVSERRIYFRTRSHPQERRLDLKDMDFTGGRPLQYFNLHPRSAEFERFQPALAPAAPRFEELTEARNLCYVEAYLNQAWLKRGFGNLMPLKEAILLHLRDSAYGRAPAGSMTAEAVLRQALAARGGAEAAARIQSLYTAGTLDMSWSATRHAPLEWFQMRPNRNLVLVRARTGPKASSDHYEFGCDGQHCWEMPLDAPAHAFEGKALEEYRAGPQPALDELEEYTSARCLGTVSFDGRKCWALKVVPKSGMEEIRYYDAASYLPVGILAYSAAIRTWVRTSLDDYREFGGFKFPTRVRCQRQWNRFALSIRSVEVNAVPESRFKLPAALEAR